MPCLAPSEFLTPQAASLFGSVAERFIQADYLRHVGRAAFFPANPKDFADFSIGFGNTALYVAFLKANNPRLSPSELLALSAASLLKIPDLMTHDPGVRFEFYEIKPNSPDGRLAGMTKVALIDAMLTAFSLPYKPGLSYAPVKDVILYSGSVFGKTLEVRLHWERIAPGLLVYEICVDGTLVELGLKVLLAVLAAIIAILLRRFLPRLPTEPLPVPTMA